MYSPKYGLMYLLYECMVLLYVLFSISPVSNCFLRYSLKVSSTVFSFLTVGITSASAFSLSIYSLAICFASLMPLAPFSILDFSFHLPVASLYLNLACHVLLFFSPSPSISRTEKDAYLFIFSTSTIDAFLNSFHHYTTKIPQSQIPRIQKERL